MSSVSVSSRAAARGTAQAAGIPLGLLFAAGAIAALVASPHTDVAGQVQSNAIAATCVGLAGAFLITHRVGLVPALAAGRIGPWASVSFALVFGLASLQWTVPQDGLAASIAQSTVASALGLIVWGWAAWIVGYLIGVPLPVRRGATWLVNVAIPPASEGQNWRRSGVWLLFGISLVGAFLRIVINTFGYLQGAESIATFSSAGQAVTILSTMGLFAVVLAAVNYFSPEQPGRLGPLLLVSSVQVFLAVLQGTKEGTAVVAIAIVLSYARARARMPTTLLIVATLLFTFVVLPFVTNYREAINSGRVTGVGSAVKVLPSVTSETVSQRRYEQNLDLLAARLRQIDSLSIVMQRSPQPVAYVPVTDLITQPTVGLVPRVLWPGKPAFLGSYEFGNTYYGTPRSFVSAFAITPPADLYRHGGPIVLILGMVLLGGIYRMFDDVLRPSDDFRHLFLIVALFPALVKHEIDVASLLLTLPVSLLGVAVAVRALALVGNK